jgi:hypothetical protein
VLRVNGAAPRLWTGEAVLDHALEVAGFKVEDLKRSMEVTREALDASTPSRVEYFKTGEVRAEIDGGPDHGTRLRASENIFGWVGLRGSRQPQNSQLPQTPLVVMWISQQPPPPLSSPTLPDPSRPNSTESLPPDTRASVSWSAIDGSASP